MTHDDVVQYLSPEFPKESRNESSRGLQYRYMIDQDAFPFLEDNLPRVGDLWDRGLDITSLDFTPRIGNSRFHMLEVSTVRSISGGGGDGGSDLPTEFQEARYQIRWMPNSLPLLKHPAFAPSEFDPGDYTIFLRDVIGWENELSEVNKANYRYYPRDENGNATGSLVTVNPLSRAGKYITLRNLGHENYIFHAPNWTKVSIYRGTLAPGIMSIGQFGAPDGEGFPAGWEWVKTDDSAERIGNAPIWQRTETWTGAKSVDYDVDQLFV